MAHRGLHRLPSCSRDVGPRYTDEPKIVGSDRTVNTKCGVQLERLVVRVKLFCQALAWSWCVRDNCAKAPLLAVGEGVGRRFGVRRGGGLLRARMLWAVGYRLTVRAPP